MPPQRAHGSVVAENHSLDPLYPFKVIENNLLLCITCQSCVWPSQLKTHLKASHKLRNKGQQARDERSALLERLQSIEGLQDQASWQPIFILERRIPELPLIKAYTCLQCEKKTAKALSSLRVHQSSEHGRTYHVGGHTPYELLERTKEDQERIAHVYGQYLFKGGATRQCIPVRGLYVEEDRGLEDEEPRPTQGDENDEVVSEGELRAIAFAHGPPGYDATEPIAGVSESALCQFTALHLANMLS